MFIIQPILTALAQTWGAFLHNWYFLLLSVVSSAVQGIFNAALYRYACFKQVPPAFDAALVTSAWTPKS